MTQEGRPVWVELSSTDPAASRAFYSSLFGWHAEPSPDPQYGGYAVARTGDADVAGIGGTQSPEQPTSWLLYLGTPDVDALAERFSSAGGTLVAPPFDVGPMGRMAVLQDPAGAFIAAWQGTGMSGFSASGDGTYAWGELNVRGAEQAAAFYADLFGWTARTSDMGEGRSYTELIADDESVLGAFELPAGVPDSVPAHWLVYFASADVDATTARALDLGATTAVQPMDMPGGRFAVVQDPQGAVFGLLRLDAPA